jgi:hypothetical protein
MLALAGISSLAIGGCVVRARAPGVAVAPSQVALGGPPNYGYMPLNQGFMPDPVVAQGQAGGNLNSAQMVNPGCRGWITSTPDHVLQTQTGFQFFRIFVRSNVDTTLIVRRPDGQFMCNDDGGQGLNPMVQNSYWPPGEYQIWVGAYAQRATGAPHQIFFTELPGVM